MTARLGVDAANTASNAIGTRLNNGYVRIYDGERPEESADNTLGNQVLLAEARFGNPAFNPASGGIIASTAIAEVRCQATGRAAWFQALRSDGVTVEFDGTVGTTDADLIVDSVDFETNWPLQILGVTYQTPLQQAA